MLKKTIGALVLFCAVIGGILNVSAHVGSLGASVLQQEDKNAGRYNDEQ